MARKHEPLNFAGSLEVQSQKPLDARRKVTLIADLTDAASFPYIYKGLDVFCEENSKWYTFLGGDRTDANNWRMEGSGGGTGGNANFDIGTVPLGGAGVYEVNAILSNNDSERVRAIYSRGVNGELPDWFSMSVTSGLGTDDFHVATKEYADKEVAKKGNAKITFDSEYQYLQIRDDNGTDIGFSQETANTVRVQEYAKDSRGQVQPIFDETLASKAYVDDALADKQDTLVSGTNIKTINGQPVVGSGDLILHQGVGDGLDLNNMPSYNQLEQMINSNALLYIDGNWLVTGLYLESTTAQVVGEYANKTRSYYFDTDFNLDAPMIYGGTYVDGYSTNPSMIVNADSSQPYGEFTRGDGQVFRVWGLDQRIGIDFTDQRGRQQRRNYDIGINIKVGEEKWQGTYTDENNETFQVYSKMVYIPALPATAGITTYDHGVSNIKQILNIYGFTADGFVLNAPRQNAQDNIAIYQASKSATNQTFSIEVGKDRSSKKAYVVMVYAKNN